MMGEKEPPDGRRALHARPRRLTPLRLFCLWRPHARRLCVVEREVVCDQRGGFDGHQGVVRQGFTYAEIGRTLGRDWRTVKRYLEEGAQPVYRRSGCRPSWEFKPLIDQWLAEEPRLLATRVHQDLVRDYGFGAATTRSAAMSSAPGPSPSRA